MSNNIKAVLLLGLAFLFSMPSHAQVSSLQVTYTATQGNYTLSWIGFAPTHYLKENGTTIQSSSSTSRTILGKAPGTYSYIVQSCSSSGPGCIYSNTVTVTVVASPPPPPPPAPPLEFTVGSLQQFMDAARGQDKSLANLIGDEVETRLRNANLSFDENGLTYSENLPDYQIRSGCSKNFQLRHLHASASLNNASRFDIMMDSLSRPIVATAQLIGTVEAGGQVRLRLGFKVFGECIRYLKASVDGSVKTDFTINASLVIRLNPQRLYDTPAGTLKIGINPVATLDGKMSVTNTTVNLTNANLSLLGVNLFSGVVGNLLEKQILKLGSAALTGSLQNLSVPVNSYFGQYLATAQAEINVKLAALPRAYTVPVDGMSNGMLSFISYYALNYFPGAGFLQANSTELMYLLLVGDDKAIRDRVATSLACNSSASMQTLTMNHAATPVPYRPTTITEFCATIDNKNWLGNADPAVSGYNGEDAWTLAPATSFDLSQVVAPINSNFQPYMKRVNYRTIDGISDGTRATVDQAAYGAAMYACHMAGPMGQCVNPPNINNYMTYTPIPRGTGSCKLEMRVYKEDVAQTGLRPLLAIHGGGWMYRGTGFYLMESQISHFTKQGFVVFAPFYRLVNDLDGNIECNNATGEQLIADVDAAMTWVQNNKATYGVSSGEKVRLYGQSAGAHAAGWLLTHRAPEVQKALLMYPPTDARDYAINYQAYTSGQPYDLQYGFSFGGRGTEFVEAYLSTVGGQTISLRDVDPNSSLVLNNSIPYLVAGSPSYYPPAYMVHGKVDQLVPAIHSVRMCNAYTGNPSSGPANTAGTALRQSFDCGPSHVELLQNANHGLELCVPPIRCEAGNSQAALDEARTALSLGRAWLAQ